MTKYIAFYGTLQSSHSTPAHDEIRKGLYRISDCIIPGLLYRKARYPALKEGKGHVKGELYKVHNDHALAKLDKYELIDDENPERAGFTRKRVKLLEPQVSAWVYYYDGEVSSSELIASGRWQ